MSSAVLALIAVIVVFVVVFMYLFIKKDVDSLKETVTRIEGATASQLPALQTELQNLKGELSSSMAQSLRVAKDIGAITAQWENFKEVISRLNQIFSDTVRKGKVGEFLLEQILSAALPPFLWARQYNIAGKSADAVIFLKGKELVLPVDSKFPADKALAVLQAEKQEKKSAWTEFKNTIKRQAKEIAEKYIHPEKGTTDYALMFVPSEDLLSLITSPVTPLGGDNTLLYELQKQKIVVAGPSTIFAVVSLAITGHQSLVIEEKASEFLSIVQEVVNKLEEIYATSQGILEDARRITRKAEKIAKNAETQKGKLKKLKTGEEPSTVQDDALLL